MTTISTPIRYTPADVDRLSSQEGKLYELVDGTLVEKHVSKVSTNVAAELVFLLRSAYPRSRAHVFVEQPTYCFADPAHGRRPDVALVWAERFPGGLDEEELFLAPDLVVEVVSPTNGYEEMLERVDEYLDAGVPLVLVAEPKPRALHLFRKDGSGARLRASEMLANEPLLPGLAFRVGDIFPLTAPAPAPGSGS